MTASSSAPSKPIIVSCYKNLMVYLPNVNWFVIIATLGGMNGECPGLFYKKNVTRSRRLPLCSRH